MVEYGVLAAVVLYRDRPRDRWRWAIYDSLGVWDGWLPEPGADAEFELAAIALEAHLLEHWKQVLQWRWEQTRADWWAAGLVPGEGDSHVSV